MTNAIPQIVYWKWDRTTLVEKQYRQKIEDLCRRSIFTHVYVSPVWCGYELCDPVFVEAIRDAAERLQRHGRRLVLDVDVRTCRKTFARRYPDDLLWLWQTREVELTGGGCEITLQERTSSDHFGEYPVIGSRLVRLLLYRVASDGGYDPESVREAGKHQYECTQISHDALSLKCAGRWGNATHGMVIGAFQFEYPDPFSPRVDSFLDELFGLYRDMPIGGACLDEWGYPPYPFFSFSRAWKDPWYRHGADEAEFVRRALDLMRAPAGKPERRDAAAIRFAEETRRRCAAIENRFYARVKEIWGGTAFVGVHPTWHAIDPVYNSPEIWKNGFDWFEVHRDYAQTDEFAPYPIRMALSHKWGDRPFFNMWYSCGSLDIGTFVTETWRNARYGGRTHFLGYECPNETDHVLELITGDRLETVSRVEERITMLNAVQTSSAHSPVLVLMGINAAVSPSRNHVNGDHWDLRSGPFVDANRLAVELWQMGYVCDLVPATEIDNAALAIDPKGHAKLGANVYEAVIIVAPEYLSQSTLLFLEQLVRQATPVFLIGRATRDDHGQDISARFGELRKCVSHADEVPLVMAVDTWLRRHGVAPNDLDGGCRLNDGMVIFTSHTRRPAGTPLRIDCDVSGHRVEADAEDLFAIRLKGTGEIDRLAAGMLSVIRIDGKEVLHCRSPQDTIVI